MASTAAAAASTSAATTTTSSTLIKHAILVLHGYGMTSASIMAKTGALRSEVKKFPFEFIGLDGPFDCQTEARMPPQPIVSDQQQQQDETKAAKNDNNDNKEKPGVTLPANLTLEEGARAWYSFEKVNETGKYEKFDEGVKYIIDHCVAREKQGLAPYRGIFAFSQSTIMATYLAARLEQEKKAVEKKKMATEKLETDESKNDDDDSTFKKVSASSSRPSLPECLTHIEFVTLVSGLLPKDQSIRNEIISSAPISIPSLHIVGKTDRLVDPERTRELAELFADVPVTIVGENVVNYSQGEKNSEEEVNLKMVWEHEGGHVIPSQARKPFKHMLQGLMRSGKV